MFYYADMETCSEGENIVEEIRSFCRAGGKRMRRICCFCETWESGGIESFLSNALLNMDLSGLEVDIVAARIGNSVFTKALSERGVKFRELSGNIRDLKRNFKAFRSLLCERRYDVVHINLYQGLSLYYCVLAKKADVSVRIVHSHNTDLRKSRTRWIKYILHEIGKRCFDGSATDLWACSVPAGRFLFKRNGDFRVIPNGISTDKFRFNESRRNLVRSAMGLEDAFVVGNIGRLSYQKNQSFLIDVLAELVRIQPNSILLLIGDGEKRNELKEKAHRLGVSDRVIFYGTTEEIPDLLWSMDVFSFPSHLEGLGIVAIEAQAAGLPVICSEHVPREAFLTPIIQMQPLSSGTAGWARAICNVKKPKRELLADEISKAGFDIRTVVCDIESVYRRIEKHHDGRANKNI